MTHCVDGYFKKWYNKKNNKINRNILINMKKILYFLSFVVLASSMMFLGVHFISAADPTEIALDDNTYGSSCYGGYADFYTDIPFSYSGNKVYLRAKVPSNPYGCAVLRIDLCSWNSSCYVNVTPGQRLNFQVSFSCVYCGDYENESWYVYVDSVACGDGACSSIGGENCSNCPSDCQCYSSQCCSPSSANASSKGCVDSGETTSSTYICCSGSKFYGTCCSDSDCSSGYECSDHKCAKELYCGDAICNISGGENCSTCPADCSCFSSYYCCHPTSSYANPSGCVTSGERISSTYICCSGGKFYGTCCSDSDCISGYECANHTCVISSYCGDGACTIDENCSDCPSDCQCSSSQCCYSSSSNANLKGCVDSGEMTSSTYICCSGNRYNGSCCSDSDCSSGYKCSDHKCAKELYCGDGTCDSSESCSSCSSDCGDCPPQEPSKKPDSSACSSYSQCQGGYCVHGYCRSSLVYCGDNKCDTGEKCSICSADCGSCKVDGSYCDYPWQCKSDNCQNYRCCLKGKTCCLATSNCPNEYYCSESRSYCLPGKPDGQLCAEDEYCKSGNCDNGICCEWGQDCCQKHINCGSQEYCDDEVYYCRYKWPIGEKCSETAMCYSDYCDRVTWTCAEKPDDYQDQPDSQSQQETSTSALPETTKETEVVEGEVLLSVPRIIELKRTEEYSPLISIRNGTNQTIVLGDRLEIFNNIPALIEVDKPVLRILGSKKLAPGKEVSVEAESIDHLIEDLVLKAKRAGKGEIQFSAVYFLNNKVQKIKQETSLTISSEHFEREENASTVFDEDMILAEKREVLDSFSQTTKEYVFVEPEDDILYNDSTNSWQMANQKVQKHLNRIKDDFVGSYDPEIVSFFKTIQELEAAQTVEEITETTLRTITPPAIIAAVDFVSLLDAIDEQKKEEKAFLDHFGASVFADIPVYSSSGGLIGYSRAVIKEEDGIIYAVKIGNL